MPSPVRSVEPAKVTSSWTWSVNVLFKLSIRLLTHCPQPVILPASRQDDSGDWLIPEKLHRP